MFALKELRKHLDHVLYRVQRAYAHVEAERRIVKERPLTSLARRGCAVQGVTWHMTYRAVQPSSRASFSSARPCDPFQILN